jgi:heat shock protein HslJ
MAEAECLAAAQPIHPLNKELPMPACRPPLQWMFALALAAPAWALAADAAAQPTPQRRSADAALVRTLQDHRWTLQGATDSAGQPMNAVMVAGQPFVMQFDGARLAVQGGCNQMNGSWRLSPQGQMTVGRLAATMKACEPPLMQADAALSALLAQPLQTALTAGATPRLELKTAKNETLMLSGQPTLQSLYGKPTRMFLEVAPQTVPCQPGAGAPTQCLRVRERRFDAQGLRIEPPGEWRAFYERIDGYTHTPGVRNVLRIDRYTRKQVPADASAHVYVLDLVVESESASK